MKQGYSKQLTNKIETLKMQTVPVHFRRSPSSTWWRPVVYNQIFLLKPKLGDKFLIYYIRNKLKIKDLKL